MDLHSTLSLYTQMLYWETSGRHNKVVVVEQLLCDELALHPGDNNAFSHFMLFHQQLQFCIQGYQSGTWLTGIVLLCFTTLKSGNPPGVTGYRFNRPLLGSLHYSLFLEMHFLI